MINIKKSKLLLFVFIILFVSLFLYLTYLSKLVCDLNGYIGKEFYINSNSFTGIDDSVSSIINVVVLFSFVSFLCGVIVLIVLKKELKTNGA